MLAQLLEYLFSSIDSTLVTNIFIWAVIIVFLIAWWCDSKNIHSKFREYAPTLMGALGILGTFVGIIIGLLNFNTENIDASIPILLGGLKTAFITSIVGMSFAIIFNGLDAFFFANRRNKLEIPEVSPEDIYQELKEQTKFLEKLIYSTRGEEEGSIFEQMKLLRSEIKDISDVQLSRHTEFSNKLWDQLQQFANLMAKGATEQIIDALRQVIVDFNKNLTEQFGENFKALDASVKKLVDWQEKYKMQVEQMGEQYQQSVDSLVETKKAVSGIWEECQFIPVVMTKLEKVLEINQHQIDELSRHLDVYAEIRDKATTVLPEINRKMTEIGESLKLGAEHVNTSLTQTQSALTTMATNTTNMSETVKTLFDTASNGLTSQVVESLGQFGSAINEQLKAFGESTNQEMNRELQTLADALTSISRGFVNEYDRLIKEYSKVMESLKSLLR